MCPVEETAHVYLSDDTGTEVRKHIMALSHRFPTMMNGVSLVTSWNYAREGWGKERGGGPLVLLPNSI